MPALPSNPGNSAKQPVKHWQATPATLVGNITGNPAIATAFSPTIHAMTICEVIVLTITPPIHGESLPVFLHDHVPFTHSLIMSGIMHSLTRHAHARARSIIIPATRDDAPHRIGNAREARNLFVGTGSMAVAPCPTQPDSQPKSISVALPTATQTLFWPLPCYPCLLPLVPLCSYRYSYWTSSMPSFFAVSREEES